MASRLVVALLLAGIPTTAAAQIASARSAFTLIEANICRWTDPTRGFNYAAVLDSHGFTRTGDVWQFRDAGASVMMMRTSQPQRESYTLDIAMEPMSPVPDSLLSWLLDSSQAVHVEGGNRAEIVRDFGCRESDPPGWHGHRTKSIIVSIMGGLLRQEAVTLEWTAQP